jgi:hypothetical protein
VRARIVMERPQLNFVHGPSDEETQTGAHQPWLTIMNDLSPFRIDSAQINDGEIHFQAFHTDPTVDVYLGHVDAEVTNLTNVQDELEPLMAHIRARGTAMDPMEHANAALAPGAAHDHAGGRFEFAMDLDPSAYRPHFDLAARLLDFDVTQLNSLTKAYGKFDFEAGTSDFVVELSARNGTIDGYAKPLFRNLVVVTWEDVETDDPLELFWEAVVGVAQEVFQNQPRTQFGTRLSISGDLTNPKTSVLEIVSNVLRNAFLRAYLPDYDESGDSAGDAVAVND